MSTETTIATFSEDNALTSDHLNLIVETVNDLQTDTTTLDKTLKGVSGDVTALETTTNNLDKNLEELKKISHTTASIKSFADVPFVKYLNQKPIAFDAGVLYLILEN